ncbi:MAG: hypothetical protein ACP5G2_05275 [Candidatus Bipolaricaulaceae bacterium]
MSLLVALMAVCAVGWGQQVQLEAPWLTVYDASGQPRWEVQLEELHRTDSGWEGREVRVRLFTAGQERVSLQAPEITADRLGRTWTLAGPVSGWAGELAVTCSRARWADGLHLAEVTACGDDFSLTAAAARWDGGDVVELEQVTAELGGWQVELAGGQVDLQGQRLDGVRVRLAGHGLEVEADSIAAWPAQERVVLKEARLVSHP